MKTVKNMTCGATVGDVVAPGDAPGVNNDAVRTAVGDVGAVGGDAVTGIQQIIKIIRK